MKKTYAINLLGGTPTKVGRQIGKTPQAITMWADPLTPAVEAVVMFEFSKLTPHQRRKNKAFAEAQTKLKGEK